MKIEPSEILHHIIAALPRWFEVIEANPETGALVIRWYGTDNKVFIPFDALAALVDEAQRGETEGHVQALSAQPIIDRIADSLVAILDESFSSTPNPERVWTYHDGWFEPVPPDRLADHTVDAPVIALTLSGYGIVGLTSSTQREVLPEELGILGALADRLYQWLEDVAAQANVAGFDQSDKWHDLNARGAGLAGQIQGAVGSAMPVKYEDLTQFAAAQLRMLASGRWQE